MQNAKPFAIKPLKWLAKKPIFPSARQFPVIAKVQDISKNCLSKNVAHFSSIWILKTAIPFWLKVENTKDWLIATGKVSKKKIVYQQKILVTSRRAYFIRWLQVSKWHSWGINQRLFWGKTDYEGYFELNLQITDKNYENRLLLKSVQ